MCTSPIQIYNRASRISARGQSLLFTVPCGKCEECKKNKAAEWSLRSYFQHKECLSKGGYTYFDTLTYSNSHLPKHFGIAHFSKSDVQNCLHKLRTYLTRAGFEVKDNLKYFVTSEYGGKTHRPHYHVIFYITIPDLDVKTFWQYLNKSWTFGFIDRYANCTSRVVNSIAAINYVSGYVQKDQEWTNVVERKLARLNRIGAAARLEANLKDYEPFHIQSKGYGAAFLDFTSLDEIITNGYIIIPDRQYLIKNYAIPEYYKRKLFYYKDSEGLYKLNKLGKEFKLLHLDDLINQQLQRYQATIDNLRQYNYYDSFDLSVVPRLITKYLDGRSLRDFVIYATVYRNRMWNSSSLVLPDYHKFYRLSLDSGTIESKLYDEDVAVRSSFRNRYDKYRITQFRYSQFKDFDYLYNLFKAITDYFNLQTDKESKRVQAIRDRLKLLLAS